MTPRCSIVVPVYGRPGLTRRCLDAVLAHSSPSTYELIVVIDGFDEAMETVLAGYDNAIRTVTRSLNGGFAAACNGGAAEARGEFVVFLNNDAVPSEGWLDALVDHADDHRRAAAVGARLLYPDGTVQHAGVVVCADGNPRHVYAGFPGDHPAVTRPRRFHAVTAACLLVRREAFEQAGAFDDDYRNGLEDVDLCLKLGALGHEVHYCPGCVLTHLESISRGRQTSEIEANARRFRERWGGLVRPDELDVYLADGLIEISYEDAYPIRVRISPLLAAVDPRTNALERLLERRARQVFDLLRETVRLTARVAELELGSGQPEPDKTSALLERADTLELELHALQSLVADSVADTATLDEPFTPSPYLEYRRLVERIQSAVRSAVAGGQMVLVASRGDEGLLELDGRPAMHFPRDDSGQYAGHHPADSAAAIAELERGRADGADYLLLPESMLWLLEHYEEFARHLDDHYPLVWRDDQTCRLYELGGAG